MNDCIGHLNFISEERIKQFAGKYSVVTLANKSTYGPLLFVNFSFGGSEGGTGGRTAVFAAANGMNPEFFITDIVSIDEYKVPTQAQKPQADRKIRGLGTYYEDAKPIPEFHDLAQATQRPNVVPIYQADPATFAKYQAAGWAVMPVSEAFRLASETVDGLGSFWSGFWGAVTWPFKTAWKGAKWLAVQPVHGFKWVWNEAKKQYEMVKEETPERVVVQPPSTAGLSLSNPWVLAGGALAFYLLYVTLKKKPLVPQVVTRGF